MRCHSMTVRPASLNASSAVYAEIVQHSTIVKHTHQSLKNIQLEQIYRLVMHCLSF